MTDTHEIVKAAPVQIERSNPRVHPMLSIFQQQGGQFDTATMREMMQLQREWEAGEAKKSYTLAMVALKTELPSVLNRDSHVEFGTTKYNHTSLASAMEITTPHLSKYGFSASWHPSTDDRGNVSVTCRITHQDGHFEESTIVASADAKGGKNAAQAVASTITMLSRYSYLSLLGIATADMKETVDREPDEKIDLTLNQRAIGSMVRLGETKESLESFIGKPFTEWNSDDLQDLRDLKEQKLNERKQQPREPGQEG
jgi:hypothetical protein